MHTASPLYLQIPNYRSKILILIYAWLNLQIGNLGILKANCIVIEKYPCISGLQKFKACCSRVNLYS